MTLPKCLPSYLCSAALIGPSAWAVDYEKEIRPIFEKHCYECHGPEKQKSKLRLDQRAVSLRGGDSGFPAIVPGNPEKSFLVEAIRGTDPDLKMPAKGDPLSAKQIATIERWIREGAKWPGQMEDAVAKLVGASHWAFQPVVRPDVPKIGGPEQNPIDAFLMEKLVAAGLAPNPQADARTQIRRASIVMTGLPPTPERVALFEKNFAMDPEAAYGALIEELLVSPHFGERWAQHWLDVIRWAETNGSESNLYRKNAWVYRDYVVRAFNEDKPYDQFVREQVAGDTHGVGDAMGFLVAGPHVPAATVGQEKTAIRQARADRMDEIVQTVGASVMGITVGCARCHNHKFDPISTKDYYAMTAVFQDIEFGSRRPEFARDHPRRKQGTALWAAITEQRNILRKTGPWVEDWGGYREVHFPPVNAKSVRVLFKTPSVGIDELEIFGPGPHNENLAHKARGTAVAGPDAMVTDGRNKITRINDGQYGTMAWRARAPKGSKDRPWAELTFAKMEKINRLRLSTNREYFFETDFLATPPKMGFKHFELEVRSEDGEWRKVASTWWIVNGLNKKQPARAAAVKEINRLALEFAERGPRPSFVGRFIKPVVTRVFHRGSPESPRDEVMPAGPAALGGDLKLTSASAGKVRRARFGEWLVAPENPLTARVMANRLWHHTFGSGIVPTPSDFGTAGATPTHPELLDWLAAEFVQPTFLESQPWSMKGLLRLLVTSEAFRRSSAPTRKGMEADTNAVMLWRFSPRRVEAEVIRDSILQASGSLSHKIGGRSYRIHNVKKTYAQWEVVDNHGPQTWRRMLYQERMRRVDDQIFTAFDFPDCGQIRAKRPVSTTPLQALNLMNSPFVVEQAALLARRAEKEASGDEPAFRIRRSFQLLLDREPDPDELSACLEVFGEAGLAMVCRSLINSNEFAFLP
ncbi:MAG: PSD1 and planctomycete cytochrome C domain-containing protein [Roseibacillus sp.]